MELYSLGLPIHTQGFVFHQWNEHNKAWLCFDWWVTPCTCILQMHEISFSRFLYLLACSLLTCLLVDKLMAEVSAVSLHSCFAFLHIPAALQLQRPMCRRNLHYVSLGDLSPPAPSAEPHCAKAPEQSLAGFAWAQMIANSNNSVLSSEADGSFPAWSQAALLDALLYWLTTCRSLHFNSQERTTTTDSVHASSRFPFYNFPQRANDQNQWREMM